MESLQQAVQVYYDDVGRSEFEEGEDPMGEDGLAFIEQADLELFLHDHLLVLIVALRKEIVQPDLVNGNVQLDPFQRFLSRGH